MILAIDGPAASGKGTIARALAAHYDLPHLDTGLLYRAVAYVCEQHSLVPEDMAMLPEIIAAGERALAKLPNLSAMPELRSEAIGAFASRVSKLAEVRHVLLAYQRDFAAQQHGAVLDGRDIGTVIAPQANVKLFITASAQVRAERRAAQEPHMALEAILAEIIARDARDTQRAEAPLKPAPDALLLDTSELSIAAAIQAAQNLVQTKLGGGDTSAAFGLAGGST
jgi:CMP/dCMP kinase